MKKQLVFMLLVFMCCVQRTYAIGTPALSAPANAATGYNRNPSFTWQAVSGADRYDIQVSTSNTFSTIVVSRTGLYITRFVPLAELPITTLYWRVRAIGTSNDTSSWSSSFTYVLANYPRTYNIANGAAVDTIRKILDTAAAHTPALVKFAANGTYNLDPGSIQFMFNLNAVNDLMIDGNNASITIINHLETGFLQFKNSNRIIVKRLKIDWDPLPHSFLDVIKVNSKDSNTLNINVRLRKVAGKSSAYYPDIYNDTTFTKYWSWTCLMDTIEHGALKKNVPNVFGINAADVTPIACTNPPQYNIYKPGSKSGKYFAVGDVLGILCRDGVGSLLSTQSCTDITFDSVTNYASPIGCYYSIDGSDMKVLSCNSAIKDSTRFLSANADGVHCRANTIGPWVENCSFIGNGDDAVALYNKGVFIKTKNSATNLTVLNTYMNFKNGDMFDLYTPKTGAVLSEGYTLTANPVNNGNGTFTLAFSPQINNTDYAAMTDVGNTDVQQNVQLFNVTRRNENFMVYNNRFTVRGRGAIIRTSKGVVANNKIYECSSSAVGMYNEPSFWTNGLYCSDIRILDNDIRDCAFDNLGVEAGAVTIKFYKIKLNGSSYDDTLSASMPHNNILVSGNTIRNFGQYGIALFNAKNSKMLNNTFTSTTTGFSQTGKHYGIYLNVTDSCTVSGNNFSGETRTLDANIKVESSTNQVIVP